jgi:hypothetical protein
MRFYGVFEYCIRIENVVTGYVTVGIHILTITH